MIINTTKRKNGFTLAEVLITIGIIGIVAAMTLPAVIGNYKKQEVVSRLKKFYVTLNQALLMSVAKNGPMEYWDFPADQNNGKQMDAFVNKYLFPYFTGLKECNSTDNDNGCRNIARRLMGGVKSPVYIFSDGGCFSLLKGGGNSESGMIHIFYDINCQGNPNEFNRDTFAFTIRFRSGSSFVLKVGSTATFSLNDRDELLEQCTNTESSPHARGACGALIYFDGWEIKEDYPYKI